MRRFFTKLFVVSMVLCAATSGLGLRGYWAHDVMFARFERRNTVEQHDFYRTTSYELHSCAGTLSLLSSHEFFVPAPTAADPLPVEAQWPVSPMQFGLRSGREAPPADGGDGDLQDGLWRGRNQSVLGRVNLMPISASLLVCAFGSALIGLWPRRPALGRRCAVCGYDLRASPGRCPECGTMPTRKVTVPT